MDKHLKEVEDRLALAKQNYEGPFCCFSMDNMLENSDQLYNVKYSPKIREYSLKSLEGPYICPIEFCPWCGFKLPKSLNDEWFDILEEEYGLDLPDIPPHKNKVPAEFLTEEWWKKRGL